MPFDTGRRELLKYAAMGGLAAVGLVSTAAVAHSRRRRLPQRPGPPCESKTAAEARIIRVPEGDVKQTMTYKLTLADTRNNYTCMQTIIEPHQLVAPHIHYEADQCVLMLTEGHLQFQFDIENGDSSVYDGFRGDFITKPRGISHTFWNPTEEPVLYLEYSTRTTFERFIDLRDEHADDHSLETLKADEKAEATNFSDYFQYIVPLMAEHHLISVKDMGGIPAIICDQLNIDCG